MNSWRDLPLTNDVPLWISDELCHGRMKWCLLSAFGILDPHSTGRVLEPAYIKVSVYLKNKTKKNKHYIKVSVYCFEKKAKNKTKKEQDMFMKQIASAPWLQQDVVYIVSWWRSQKFVFRWLSLKKGSSSEVSVWSKKYLAWRAQNVYDWGLSYVQADRDTKNTVPRLFEYGPSGLRSCHLVFWVHFWKIGSPSLLSIIDFFCLAISVAYWLFSFIF